MKLEIRHFTDTAHILPDTEYLCSKGCARLHGHTYAFKVLFDGNDIKGGMVVDFKLIKELIDTLDHRTLIFKETHPDLLEFLQNKNSDQVIEFPHIPSSENISRYIGEEIKKKYPDLLNIEVSVCEGYKGSERANWTTYKVIN